jgi:hypothetical protein
MVYYLSKDKQCCLVVIENGFKVYSRDTDIMGQTYWNYRYFTTQLDSLINPKELDGPFGDVPKQ